MIKEKKLIYDYKSDQRKNKFENNETLRVLDKKNLPKYVQEMREI